MIPVYSDTVNLNYDRDTLLRHKAFVDAVTNRLGINIKATSANDGSHAQGGDHGVDGIDYSWDDLSGWDNPDLAVIGDIAREYGFANTINTAHGSGPHVHVGGYNGGGRVAIPNQQQLPIKFNDIYGNPTLDVIGAMRTADYNEKLDPSLLQQAANVPIQNSKRAAQQAFMQSMPMIAAAYGSGSSSEAVAKAMPILQQMQGMNVAASEQDANIANEQAKRQNTAQLLQAYAASKNPQNMGAIAAMIQGNGGPNISPEYANMSFINPTNALSAAIQGAANRNTTAVHMAQLAQQKAYQDAMIGIYGQKNDIAAQKAAGGAGGGLAFTPEQLMTNRTLFNKLIQEAANQPGTPEGVAARKNAIAQIQTYMPLWANGDPMLYQQAQHAIAYLQDH